jgi:hypothetical protein
MRFALYRHTFVCFRSIRPHAIAQTFVHIKGQCWVCYELSILKRKRMHSVHCTVTLAETNMTAVMDTESSKHTLTRRVSFSEQPPAVHETEHDELEELFPRACDHVDGLKSLSHGETYVIHLYVSNVMDAGSVCPLSYSGDLGRRRSLSSTSRLPSSTRASLA